jgi:hypothetical protein
VLQNAGMMLRGCNSTNNKRSGGEFAQAATTQQERRID